MLAAEISTATHLRSGGSYSPQNCWDRHKQNFEFQPDGPLINIFHVQFHPFLKRYRAPAINLPQTRNTRTNTEPAPLPILIEPRIVAHGEWPRPHQAHIAFQYIK